MPRTIEIVYDKFPAIAAKLPQAVAKVVQETCFGIESTAKIRCPVDTGALRASIHTEMTGETSGMVGTNIEYSIYVNYGTTRQAAQPFMEPAAENERRHFLHKLQNLEPLLE